MNIFFSTKTLLAWSLSIIFQHLTKKEEYRIYSIKRPRRLLKIFLIRVRRLFEGGVHVKSNFLQTVIW